MSRLVRQIAARLPRAVRQELKRARYTRAIRAGRFITPEPELDVIAREVSEGDWVLDVGANVGRYTLHMSKYVGARGRVIALEPVPETFDLLSTNVLTAHAHNVTLMNLAASSSVSIVEMSMPNYQDAALENPYQAAISLTGDHAVLCCTVDQLPRTRALKLVKIDAEGHDLEVLKGMTNTLREERPIVIVESALEGSVPALLRENGYRIMRLGDSPNIVCRPS